MLINVAVCRHKYPLIATKNIYIDICKLTGEIMSEYLPSKPPEGRLKRPNTNPPAPLNYLTLPSPKIGEGNANSQIQKAKYYDINQHRDLIK